MLRKAFSELSGRSFAVLPNAGANDEFPAGATALDKAQRTTFEMLALSSSD